ncbi:carboxymuconolactone decarboxylase family protein [Defluviimonas sp. SAOS-178_SWC]|uniref:carboxymuconolactone decarboxylase family protein n=1 Tax=Defluviimonas sp. SAOS-178_SWC TaxID=3121287 RepID=UPI003221A8CE
MTAEQRAVHDRISNGPRGGVPLPFLAILDSPALCDAIQGVGEAIRYRSKMTDRQREIAILAAAAANGSGYEWDYHDKLAVKAGLTPAERQSILDGSGDGLTGGDRAIVRYVRHAVQARRANAEELARIAKAFGPEIATEATAIAGYYPLLALFLDAGELDTPLPEKITP